MELMEVRAVDETFNLTPVIVEDLYNHYVIHLKIHYHILQIVYQKRPAVHVLVIVLLVVVEVLDLVLVVMVGPQELKLLITYQLMV